MHKSIDPLKNFESGDRWSRNFESRVKTHFLFFIGSIGVFFQDFHENWNFYRLGVSKRESLLKYALGINLEEKREIIFERVPKYWKGV